MKKTLLYAAAFLAAACIGSTMVSCSLSQKAEEPLNEGEFLIKGQLMADRPDSALMFLVPMEGPHPRPVDSVFITGDGKFEFRGNVEQMAVLRLAWRQRIGTQELLVVTEPGITEVVIDSISSSYGTPQNEALQQWKEKREKYSQEMQAIFQKYPANDPRNKVLKDSLRNADNDYNYQFLKNLGRNTLSIFLNKMIGGSLDSLRRAELNELLRDTIDRTQPQPGFRK